MREHLSLAAALAVALAACGPGDRPADGRWVDHDGDGFVGSVDCDDANATVWRLLPIYADGDRDGRGAGEASTACIGARAPAGWAVAAGDCDDTLADRWREVTGYADADGDGLGVGDAVTECRGDDLRGLADATGDCAPEDGNAWRELAYAYRDGDLDEVFVEEVGFACGGLSLPDGHSLGPVAVGDCDDGDADVSVSLHAWPDADGDGIGAGEPRELCTPGALPERWAPEAGDCAPDDPARHQLLPYAFADGDADTVLAAHQGTICAGAALPAGYALSASTVDCDDDDENRWATWLAYPDADADRVGAGTAVPLCIGSTRPEGWSDVGGDCAPDDDQRSRELSFAYRDADGDARTVAAPGTVCAGAGLPDGYSNAASGSDCDDDDPLVHTSLTGFTDGDVDGVGTGDAQEFCTAGALPDGYAATAGDCAPADARAWRMLPHAGVDQDRDTWTVAGAGSACSGAALPEPYVAALHGNDCDDAEASLWRWVVLYRDGDADGVGTPPRSIPCLGDALPDGWSTLGYDPDDTRKDVIADDALLELLVDVL